MPASKILVIAALVAGVLLLIGHTFGLPLVALAIIALAVSLLI